MALYIVKYHPLGGKSPIPYDVKRHLLGEEEGGKRKEFRPKSPQPRLAYSYFELRSKVLSLGNTQINLVFHSLIRTFVINYDGICV